MKKRVQAIYTVFLLGGCLFALSFMAWLRKPSEISVSERRKLAQPPEFSVEGIWDGSFMEDLENCSLDQFPFREQLRRLKSFAVYYLYRQKDIHGIYVAEGHAAALEETVNESSVAHALSCFRRVYESYLQDKDNSIYACIIPDKSYYLAEKNGYPAMDYEYFFSLVEEGMPYAQFIDITGLLTADSYYRTDAHWRQECLGDVAQLLQSRMNCSSVDSEDKNAQAQVFYEKTAAQEFYGVYCGQAALPMAADTIRYLDSDIISCAAVYNYETKQTAGVYDWDKLESQDPYEFFLSGAAALLTVDNPLAEGDRQLLVFRDSNASSLIPLLISDYSRIILADLRYVSGSLLGQLVDFDSLQDADVLFLYGVTLLNNSSTLK